MVGLLGMIGISLSKKPNALILVLSILIIIVFSFRTIIRNTNWENSLTLFSHDAKISKQNSYLEGLLGHELFLNNRFDEAEFHLSSAIKLNPQNTVTWYNFGVLYEGKGDFDQAKKEFERQYELSLKWNEELEIPIEATFRAQKEFFEENKEWYVRMVKKIGKPTMFELFDQRYAYFVTKFEFNFIDNNAKAAGLSTVQIDVENGERFDINYTDEHGKKQHPLILHTSIPGAIDRVLFALLEREAAKIKQGKPPSFPVWLSPAQIRIIPISDKQNHFCEKILEETQKHKVRADFDDRSETFQSKIRDAEREWIPFVVVVGEKEIQSGEVSVRIRSTGKQEKMALQKLVSLVEKDNEGKPFERVALRNKLSQRPVF